MEKAKLTALMVFFLCAIFYALTVPVPQAKAQDQITYMDRSFVVKPKTKFHLPLTFDLNHNFAFNLPASGVSFSGSLFPKGELSTTVIRSDGTIEDLGTIA